MNRLSIQHQTKILHTLVEGCSIRSTERLTGAHRDTIMRLLLNAGQQAKFVMDSLIKNVHIESMQVDELWTFIGKKDSKLTPEEQAEGIYGSQFIYVGIDSKTKLIPHFSIGQRNFKVAYKFMQDLRRKLNGYVHITTDGLAAYDNAILLAFRGMASHAQLVKVYMHSDNPQVEGYSPVDFVLTKPRVMLGSFEERTISTSFVERHNLTMRMATRRLTRLTNGFSKKYENLLAALYLYFAYYNFCRIHRTLRITPAMRAGLTDHIWSIEEILGFSQQQKACA
ncbi:MAG: IS1 family transposase [Phycisphaerae bacterium]